MSCTLSRPASSPRLFRSQTQHPSAAPPCSPGMQRCLAAITAVMLMPLLRAVAVGQVVTLHQDGEGSVIEDPSVIGEGGLLQEHLAAFRLCPEGYRCAPRSLPALG